QGREPLPDRALRVRDQLVERLAVDVHVAADLLAGLAAEQRVDRLAAVLAGDVPERDVDRPERAADRRAHEMAVAVEVLPVVLDPERVLADQVAGPDVDDPLGGLRVAPDAGLPHADDPAVGRDA